MGILSVTYRGESKAICDDAFTDNSAIVACRELFGNAAGVDHWVNG